MSGSTIAAIATGPAAGGVGIIRLSGPAALEAGRRVARSLPAEALPRHAYATSLRDVDGAVLDHGLALYFPGPASYTGEDVVELQGHGAPAVLRLVLEALLAGEGVRLAESGEFTRRAFLNGKLSLSQAEAVADLIAAGSTAAVRAASAQLSGALSARLSALQSPLLALHADLEASLDFPDEAQDVDLDLPPRLAPLRAEVQALVEASAHGALASRGARVVLYGPVNAGKSTLFNRLLGEARALVDDSPGTTRDALEAWLEWQGARVTLVDTAGLNDDAGRLEQLGIERTRAALAGADLAVLVIPPGATAASVALWRAAAPGALEVLGKADVASPEVRSTWNALPVSGATGEGVAALRELAQARLGLGVAEAALVSSARHLEVLRRAQVSLERADAAARHSTVEVVAGELGLALSALAELTGEDAPAALLDALFERFCIGK